MSDDWDNISVDGDDFVNENEEVDGEMNNNFEHDFPPPPNLSDNYIEMNEIENGEDAFSGDLLPLNGPPISSINMSSFNGDLLPLSGPPISNIYLRSFANEDEDALDILGLGEENKEVKEGKEEKEGKKSDDLTPTQKDEIGYLARYLYGKGIKINMILTDIQIYLLSGHPLLKRFDIKDLSSITKYLETYDYKNPVEIPDEKELKKADNFIGEVIHFYITFASRGILNIINDKTQSYEIQDDIFSVINLKGNLDIYNSIPFQVKVYMQENLPEMVRNYIKRHTVSKSDPEFYKRIFKYEIVMNNALQYIELMKKSNKELKKNFQVMYLNNINLVNNVEKYHSDFSNSKYSRLYGEGVYSILNINFEQMIDEIQNESKNEFGPDQEKIKFELNTKEFTDNISREIRKMSLDQRKKILKKGKSLKKFMDKLLMKTTDPVFLGMYVDVLEKNDYVLIDMIRNTIIYILADISKKTESKSKYTDKSSSFDAKVCTNETDLMGDPLVMNRNLVMVSIIQEKKQEKKEEKPKWKISTVECYLHDEISRIIKDSGVYLWNEKSDYCCGDRAFKVVKSTYLGLWLDGKIEFMTPFNTFIVYDPLNVKIGSSFTVSALHGADEKVYDVKPVNRELVYCKDCEILIGNEYIPKIEDFRESFFPDVSNFVQKEFKDGNYTGELIDGKRENFGFMIDKNGMIFAGLWKDDKFIKGFVSNNEFSRLYQGQVKDGKPNGRGKMITCNYFYDGIFKNGVFVKGKLAEKMSGDLYEGSFHNNEFQGTITILFHQDYSKKKRTVHLNNFKNLDDEKILEITDFNYKNINRRCKYKEVHVNIKGRIKDIEFLRGLPITKIDMEAFNGDLSPLKGAPISSIIMWSFNGDLSPLKGAPISLIVMGEFDGDLSPLKEAPISDILMGSLDIYNKDDFIAKLKDK